MIHIQRYSQEDIEDLIIELQKKIYNTELLDYIVEKIKYFYAEHSISFLNLQKLVAVNQKNSDNFSLEFNEDEIIVYYSCWNNHYRERLFIKPVNDYVIIRKEKNIDYQTCISLPPYTTRSFKTEIYYQNELFYIKEIYSTIEPSIDSLTGSSTITETYINSKRKAVQKTISESNDNDEPRVEYSYTEYYQSSPYDTRNYPPTTFENHMNQIDESTFQSFIANMNTNEQHKLQKINSK